MRIRNPVILGSVSLLTWVSMLMFLPSIPSAKGTLQTATDITGSWEGGLDVGAVRLRMVFHIQQDGETYVATMDIPDQGATGIPLNGANVEENKVTISAVQLAAKFIGQMDATGNEIKGTWTQGGRSLPLTLKRATGSTQRRRPQTPQPPFPYQIEALTYSHLTGKFNFGATLTIPEGEGPFPAAVLITGSGPQDRDETIFEHKPFLVLADHLTRAGMIVLRADDRGVGGTGTDGNPADDTSADYTTDVKSALAFLKSRPEVDSRKIGLIGHSEGAMIGSIVAAEEPNIAFLIMLAGHAVGGDELLYLQGEKIARAAGADETVMAEQRKLQQAIFDIILTEPNIEVGRQKARDYLLERYASLAEEERQSAGSAEAFANQHSAIVALPWFRYFIKFDPREVLEKIHCPVLALTGEKDLQVVPEQNLPEIERALKRGNNSNVTAKTMPGLNHLFQQAVTGLVSEYGEIEETFSPAALDEITNWLKTQDLIGN
jgi:uncharacterized protein